MTSANFVCKLDPGKQVFIFTIAPVVSSNETEPPVLTHVGLNTDINKSVSITNQPING